MNRHAVIMDIFLINYAVYPPGATGVRLHEFNSVCKLRELYLSVCAIRKTKEIKGQESAFLNRIVNCGKKGLYDVMYCWGLFLLKVLYRFLKIQSQGDFCLYLSTFWVSSVYICVLFCIFRLCAPPHLIPHICIIASNKGTRIIFTMHIYMCIGK